jgi:hypothetical protein
VKSLLSVLASVLLGGCSVFAQNDVATAPYTLLENDPSQKIEVRNYPNMILVSTDMSGEGRNSAFRKLFKYIAGENAGATEISMTAPVMMNNPSGKGSEIAMTAPVLMNNSTGQSMMSFVIPQEFTLQTTPKPSDPDLTVSELKNYKVATIQFSGTLSQSNVAQHRKILTQWLVAKGYEAISEPVEAAYNGPLTLPFMRRNELFIEIVKN